jgi:hypothetical protein
MNRDRVQINCKFDRGAVFEAINDLVGTML